MDIAKELLDAIPKEYHLWVALLVLVGYYGFPRFQEWRSHNRYFDSMTRMLTYKKLLYEIESIKKGAGLGDVADAGLKDLEMQAAELRPSLNVLPAAKRFLAGLVGSVGAFAVFAIFYFWFGSGEEPGYFALGAVVLSIVAGIPTLLYRADKAYKSALFGGGAGLVIALVIGILTSD